MSEMPLLKPLIRAPITMTTVTPIATPRMVSAARILCARSDPSAMRQPSESDWSFMHLVQTRNAEVGTRNNARLFRVPRSAFRVASLLAQGDHRVEPGCAARGVDARD